MSDLTNELAGMAGEVEASEEESTIQSPVRSGSGNVRNLGAMNAEKLLTTYIAMRELGRSADVEGYDKTEAEVLRRLAQGK